MHDPMTVAFDLKSPIKRKSKYFPNGYRNTLITIWHVDPERGGSDDSCGWSSPRLTKEEMEKIRSLVKFELKYLFHETEDRRFVPKVSPEQVVYNGFMLLIWQVFKRKVPPAFLPELLSLTYNHMDNFAESYRKPRTLDDIERSFYFMARAFKRFDRKWWQHPRWHIEHWRIQVHPWQDLKRWLFARCCFCKKGFAWKESVYGSWGGNKIWHGRCDYHNRVAIKNQLDALEHLKGKS